MTEYLRLSVVLLCASLLACENAAIRSPLTNQENTRSDSNNTTNTLKSHYGQAVFHLDFNAQALGGFDDADVKKQMPRVNTTQVYQRMAIIDDPLQGRVLRVKYPKDGVGPRQSGGQFDYPLPPAQEYTLSYRLYFEEGFEFVLGGKLPGLTSGGEKFTGGVHPTKGQGFSARYMWRKEGQAVVYLYSVDNKGPWGEDIALEGIKFESGRWYELKQRIKLNDPDAKNAELQVWVDGTMVLNKRDFRLRIGEQGKIDSLYFSTFFGGSRPNWAPSKDVYVRFDDFRVFSPKQ